MMIQRNVDGLIAAAQAGDQCAMEALCSAVRPAVLAFCRRMLPDRLDAEDAVQETLLLVSRRLGSYHGGGSFMGWVYTIAGREAARVARRRDTPLELVARDVDSALLHDHEGLTDPEWRAVEQEVHLACAAAVVALLGEADRLAYVLGDLLAVGHRRGAELLGITPAAYRQRLARARRIVRRHIAASSGVGSPSERAGTMVVPVADGLAAKAAALDVLVRVGALKATTPGTAGVRAP